MITEPHQKSGTPLGHKLGCDGRGVKLDFPDYMRMRQQLAVVAMRLQTTEDGPLLMLWVRQPMTEYLEGQDDGENDIDM